MNSEINKDKKNDSNDQHVLISGAQGYGKGFSALRMALRVPTKTRS